MAQYGYARISTPKQSIERQIRNIKNTYPNAKIYEDVYTGVSSDCPQFLRHKNKLRKGDTDIFDSVSRMSRNAEEGFLQYQEWYEQGINLIFLKEPHINTDTYKNAIDNKIKLTGDDVDIILEAINKYLMRLTERQIKIAFDQSEKEVQDLRQRTREGIETARLNGKQIGNKKGITFTTKKSVEAKKIILQHNKSFGGSLND